MYIMYNTVNEMLLNTFKREPRIIHIVSSGSDIEVIFRRNRNTNSTRNNTTIFYPRAAPIAQGNIVLFKDKHWLVLNREEIESEHYLCSDMTQCNIFIQALINRQQVGGATGDWWADEIAVNGYGSDNQGLSVSGSVISIVGGRFNIITEDNAYTRAISTNDRFGMIGGWYSVLDVYFINGMAHIALERIMTPPDAETFSSRLESIVYMIHEGYKYDAHELFRPIITATTNTGSTDFIIRNATLKIESSDPDIFGWDEDEGKWIAKQKGHVQLLCTWMEHGLTYDIAIDIYEYIPRPSTIVITASNPSIPPSANRIFSARFINGQGDDVTDEVTMQWSVTRPGTATIIANMDTAPTGNRIHWHNQAGDHWRINVRTGNTVPINVSGDWLFVTASATHPIHGFAEGTFQAWIGGII
jgi:hypothetical protein